jgi:hypothetical protein
MEMFSTMHKLQSYPDEVYECSGEEPTFKRNWWRASVLEVAPLSLDLNLYFSVTD